MNIQTPLFIANWKMNMPFNMVQEFMRHHVPDLALMAQSLKGTIILCPSFIALAEVCTLTNKTAIKIGAQNCSEHAFGSYTGEVDATSIAAIGCTYTLVGHSERRHLFHETDEIVGEKIARLLENNVIPIICIGETLDDYTHNTTFNTLGRQLHSIIMHSQNAKTIIIAYEPIWSIGTGKVPTIPYLNNIFSWLESTAAPALPTTNIYFLYGGSVNDTNASNILCIKNVSGLLIGNASLHFQKFQNIVLSSRDVVSTIK